jgi:hypothetical protein
MEVKFTHERILKFMVNQMKKILLNCVSVR